jgi:hypothetical protein
MPDGVCIWFRSEDGRPPVLWYLFFLMDLSLVCAEDDSAQSAQVAFSTGTGKVFG